MLSLRVPSERSVEESGWLDAVTTVWQCKQPQGATQRREAKAKPALVSGSPLRSINNEGGARLPSKWEVVVASSARR